MCRPFEIESRLNMSHLLPGFAPQQQENMYGSMNKQPSMQSLMGYLQPPMMNTNFKPQFEVVKPPSLVRVNSFEDLLECSIIDDDCDFHLNVGDEDFDATELAILSKYVDDASSSDFEPKAEVDVLGQSGVLTMNLLDDINDFDLGLTSEEDMEMLTSIELKPPSQGVATPSFDFKSDLDALTAAASFPFKSRRFCHVDGCEKRSRSHGLCIAHGGGRRCDVEGCDKSSQGGNLCIKHGGGKRCQVENCEKAAQSNLLCKMHGGGPRCLFEGCHRSSQGGGFCRTHGGGKRCLFDGCDKGTQRGDFCALHGGSRLCGVSGCMRNDRGGGFCATHGGGKRCLKEGCVKPCRRQGMCSTHLRLSGN